MVLRGEPSRSGVCASRLASVPVYGGRAAMHAPAWSSPFSPDLQHRTPDEQGDLIVANANRPSRKYWIHPQEKTRSVSRSNYYLFQGSTTGSLLVHVRQEAVVKILKSVRDFLICTSHLSRLLGWPGSDLPLPPLAVLSLHRPPFAIAKPPWSGDDMIVLFRRQIRETTLRYLCHPEVTVRLLKMSLVKPLRDRDER